MQQSQQSEQNNRNQEELIKIAQIIFPAPHPNRYHPILIQEIQHAETEQSNNVPFFLLENEDNNINNYILYCFHGNGEDLYYILQLFQIEFFQYNAKICAEYFKAQFILVEYQIYGVYNNTITTTEQIQKVAFIVQYYVKERYQVNDNQIYAFGRSIGTAPAFYIGVHRNCGSLIIFCAYLTLYKLIDHLLPFKAQYLKNENNLN